MSDLVPRLDTIEFDQLVEQARADIPRYAPDWTDHNLHDPGMTLIDLLAWIVDQQVYRTGLRRRPPPAGLRGAPRAAVQRPGGRQGAGLARPSGDEGRFLAAGSVVICLQHPDLPFPSTGRATCRLALSGVSASPGRDPPARQPRGRRRFVDPRAASPAYGSDGGCVAGAGRRLSSVSTGRWDRRAGKHRSRSGSRWRRRSVLRCRGATVRGGRWATRTGWAAARGRAAGGARRNRRAGDHRCGRARDPGRGGGRRPVPSSGSPSTKVLPRAPRDPRVALNVLPVVQQVTAPRPRWADGTGLPDQEVELATTGLARPPLEIQVDREHWQAVADFSGSGPGDHTTSSGPTSCCSATG